MNNAHVYKRHSCISQDESVRIPDVDIKHDAVNHTAAAKNEGELAKGTRSSGSEAAAINPTKKSQTGKTAANPGKCLKDNDTGKSGQDGKKEKIGGNAGVKNTFVPAQGSDKEALTGIYKKELEELAQSVAESAYFDALNKKKNELKDCMAEVQTVLDELAQKHDRFIAEYTDELKYMAVEIAEKMIYQKIDEDDTVLQKLVMHQVKNVNNAEWINVELSERLVGLVDTIKTELEKSEYNGRAKVFPAAGDTDICRVTTEKGTVVSSIGVQAENLINSFREADKK